MSARQIEQLGQQLRELNERAVAQLALGFGSFGLALVASQFRRDLAVPLLVGAVVLIVLGLVAFVRRALLVEDAATDRDAYLVAAVRHYGMRFTQRRRRRDDAASIRRLLAAPELAIAERVERNRETLEQLAGELERPQLAFEPVCAVTLERLLLRSSESALYNLKLPAEDLHSRLAQITAGVGPVRVER